MNDGQRLIVEAASTLAGQLPSETIELVAKAIEDTGQLSSRTEIIQVVSQPHHRALATQFYDEWRSNAAEVPSEAVALALRTASHVHQLESENEVVELVWTGPETHAVPFRRTEQAILQVLDSAQKRITLVSFAVYHIPNVQEALIRAARRGVRINVIVETPHKHEGENEYNTIQALGGEVSSCATVYYWPKEQRKHDGGKHGILHVKCAVADAEWLFLSSANLTKYAFDLNMELGILVKGGPMPGQVEEQFERLIGMGMLEKV